MRRMNSACIALGMALAALGNIGASANDAPVCGQANGRPATGSPIIIGAITGRTGPDDFSNSTRAARAYFDCVNANGGINGRPIAYRIEDDQWNPEIAAQLAAKLVNDDRAVMLVGGSSFVDCGANASLYERAGILSVVGVGVPRECFFARNIAPLNTGPRLSTLGAMAYAIEVQKARSVVCIGINVPNVGTWACDGLRAVAAQRGLAAQIILVDPGSADANSTVLQAAASRPDAVVLSVPKNLVLPLLAAAEEQGLTDSISWLSAAPAYDVTVPRAIGQNWNNKFYVNMEFNDIASTAADNRNWLAVMARYGTPADPRDTFSQAGYLAARVAVEALQRINGDVTRDSATAAVRAMDRFQSDILCTPWHFSANATRHNANSSTRMAVTDGANWRVVSNCTPSIDPELADLRAAERAR